MNNRNHPAHFSHQYQAALFLVFLAVFFVVQVLIDFTMRELLGLLRIAVIPVVGATIATVIHIRQGKASQVDEIADTLW